MRRAKAKLWRDANREKMRQYLRDWKERHPDRHKQKEREYRKRASKKRNDYNAKWRAENADRHRETCRKRNRENAGKINARTAQRHAAKLRATPIWADLSEIKRFYDDAMQRTRETGVPWEVDHIVPLQSAKVCGLHCEANLRVIQRSENRSKTNRWWPDMFE